METKKFDEIIFEGRNHDYGAYTLRKSYSKRMMVAVVVSVAALLMAVSYPLIAGYFGARNVILDNTEITVDLLGNRPLDDVTPPPPPPPPPPGLEKTVRFTSPIVVDDDSTDTGFFDTEKVVNKPIDTTETVIVIDTVEVKKPKIIEDLADVLMIVQEMPEYPGGEGKMMEFISQNIIYPVLAKESSISGTVYIRFVVEPTGDISNISLLRGIGGGCDEEAIRVVKMIPKWKPGKHNGNAARVWFTLPIKFTLI